MKLDLIEKLAECKGYLKQKTQSIGFGMVLAGLTLGACSQKPHEYQVTLSQYHATEKKLTKEISMVDSEFINLWIAYDTLNGTGKMHAIVRNFQVKKTIETVCLDTSKDADTISYIHYIDNGLRTMYVPNISEGRSAIIMDEPANEQSPRKAYSWNTKDEAEFRNGKLMPVTLQIISGKVDEPVNMDDEYVSGRFRDAYNEVMTKFTAVQKVYKSQLERLKADNFKPTDAFKQPDFLRNK